MFGRIAAVIIVVALAIGVFLLRPDSDPIASTSTMAPDATTTVQETTTSAIDTTTTSSAPPEAGIIDTVAEAEEVLRELWFGWFEGIYLQDEERIKEVVASQNLLDDAREQFGEMEFLAPPSIESLTFFDTEILRSEPECIAIWARVTAGFRGGEVEGVHVFRRSQKWLGINVWPLRNDLWEQDCEGQLEPLS